MVDTITIDAEHDDHVVRVVGGHPGAEWTTVCGGIADRTYLPSVDVALLHLIARRHGSDDAHGTASFYAGRVLGLPEVRDE